MIVSSTEVQPYTIGKANSMVDEIREAYLRALQYSTWLNTDFRQAAKKKIKDMVSYVGSPGKRLDPNFVEGLYKPYPDVPLDLEALFPTWIKALGLSAQYMWMDTTTPLYDETRPIPYYTGVSNDVTVPTASMLPPFMHTNGIDALHYGGLGTMIGHAMMRAFDVRGIHTLEGYVPDENDDVIREYTKRALCLRRSHKSVLSLRGQEETLSDELDSENLADLVGTKMAYDAFEHTEQRARIPDHFLLFEDRSSEKFSKRPGYDRVLFLFVVTLVLVVIGSVFVLIYLPYFQPSEELHTTVEYSKSLKEWIESREYFTTNDRTRGYSTLLQVWGDRSNITSIAKKIVEYEDKLAYIQNSDYITPRERRLLLRPIHFMGSITTPYVTSVEWSRYVSKYTNNVYRGKDMIMLRFPVLNILVEILKSPSLGRKGLMYLVFWSIYTQLEHYTNPLNYGEEEIYVLRTCYKRVYAVLSVPLTNPYLQTASNNELSKINDALEKHVVDEELEAEYVAAAEHNNKATSTLAEIRCKIDGLRHGDSTAAAAPQNANPSPYDVPTAIGPRLPNLGMPTFRGDIHE
ncbi:uncharacterized protein LOC142802912 [Rhipicephalus microplus]|uniref:uncharacterized protein LOC142802912 n=1 Tax=Rhipicephalus microplus TaxID=6941 RepID=UPI003F6AD6BA